MTGQKVTCKAQVYGSVYKLRIKGQRVRGCSDGCFEKNNLNKETIHFVQCPGSLVRGKGHYFPVIVNIRYSSYNMSIFFHPTAGTQHAGPQHVVPGHRSTVV